MEHTYAFHKKGVYLRGQCIWVACISPGNPTWELSSSWGSLNAFDMLLKVDCF